MAVMSLRPMVARDRDESHRAATPLELLFDLCFVVAIAQAAFQLHHTVDEGHVFEATRAYLAVFFAIWWAWMNFTWFASAYDTDDVLYRILVFIQIGGILVLAAGVENAARENDYVAVTIGYAIMRVGLAGQWLRAAIQHPESRGTTSRMAIGVTAVQLLWLLRLVLPDAAANLAFPALVVAELAVPVWAERFGGTTWHPEHIAERYGLFTIIVIGEAILAATTALQSSFAEGGLSWSLVGISVGGLLIAFCAWWGYFAHEAGPALRRTPSASFRWGYGHYFLFAALAAIGAGIQSVLARSLHHSELSEVEAALVLAVPVAIALLIIGLLHEWTEGSASRLPRFIVAAILVVSIAFLGSTIPLALTVTLMGIVLAGLVAFEVRDAHHDHDHSAHGRGARTSG